MEGPSLHLAAEQLRPFIGRRVRQVTGNSRIEKHLVVKNEVLFPTRTSPFAKVGRLGDRRLAAIVAEARQFSFEFLALRRQFALRRSLQVYGRSLCPACGGKISRRVHGIRGRRSFFCARCQRVGRGMS